MPIPRLFNMAAAISVETLPANGSKIVSPTKLKSLMQRLGSSIGKGAGCPTFFLLSPLNVHSPLVHCINSLRVISDFPLPLTLRQCFLYKTTINSTGAITNRALALIHDPYAVRREIFPSFHTIVA